MNKILLGGCLVAALLGCAGFADDAVWMQQKSVAIGSASFQQCVTSAVNGLQGVSVNKAEPGSATKVILDVKMAHPIPFLDAEVQSRKGSAVIMFSGRGDTESAADRGAITPVIQSIAGAIGKTCGKPAG